MYKIFILIFAMLVTSSVEAYETVVVKFPINMGWRKVDYRPAKNGSMVHYAPRWNEKDHYVESIICQSFKSDKKTPGYAKTILNKEMRNILNGKNVVQNSITTNGKDVMQWWCANDLNGAPEHCEIVRATPSQEGIILIRYINKDKKDFMSKKDEWTTRVRKALTYYSYYRTNYLFNKEIFFEL